MALPNAMRYSVLRYVYDSARDEAFNIAVAVWAADGSYADCKVLDDWHRFTALYGTRERAEAVGEAERRRTDVRGRRLTLADFPKVTEYGPYSYYLWTPLRAGWHLPYALQLSVLYDRFVRWPMRHEHPEIAAWAATQGQDAG